MLSVPTISEKRDGWIESMITIGVGCYGRIGDFESDLDFHDQTVSACCSSPTETTLMETSMPTKASVAPR